MVTCMWPKSQLLMAELSCRQAACYFLYNCFSQNKHRRQLWMWLNTQLSNNLAIFKIATSGQLLTILSLTVIWDERKSLLSHCSPFQINTVLKDKIPGICHFVPLFMKRLLVPILDA